MNNIPWRITKFGRRKKTYKLLLGSLQAKFKIILPWYMDLKLSVFNSVFHL